MTRPYVGSELELFARATNWKSYIARVLAPHVRGRVLEVGAGIGANIPYLLTDDVTQWVSLEPDAVLAGRIATRIAAGELPPICRAIAGTLARIDPTPAFDTILYVDVLEHIADDAGELGCAAERLAPGGRLIVLAPAHQFLFSPFDAAVGHYRRYSRATLRALGPASCRLTSCRMLDSMGFFASTANRLLLRQSMPSHGQIAFWDKFLVPLAPPLDTALRHRFGKSVVVVWTRV
jgi:SAM-dependent methyltransferase